MKRSLNSAACTCLVPSVTNPVVSTTSCAAVPDVRGDPGESRFYLSLEDDLMRLFNTQLVARVMAKGMPEGEPIEAKSVSKGVRTAQKGRGIPQLRNP